MAIDHVLQFPCDVRKNLPESKLRACVGYLSTAEFAIATLRREKPGVGQDELLDDYKVGISQRRPDGTTEQTPVTIRHLLSLAQPLAPYRDACGPCRANIADRRFGCIAKINYPVARESEEWLLSRLPDDENEPGLSLLFRFLEDMPIDGRKVDAQRQPRLFELQQPLVRRWGNIFTGKKITSSQILQILCFEGAIAHAQAVLYTKLLRLDSVLSDPHPPSANIEQFKTLMCAIVMAGRLQATVEVDA